MSKKMKKKGERLRHWVPIFVVSPFCLVCPKFNIILLRDQPMFLVATGNSASAAFFLSWQGIFLGFINLIRD